MIEITETAKDKISNIMQGYPDKKLRLYIESLG
jgi:Fe-S cluster assembly iron-binding protein IscA